MFKKTGRIVRGLGIVTKESIQSLGPVAKKTVTDLKIELANLVFTLETKGAAAERPDSNVLFSLYEVCSEDKKGEFLQILEKHGLLTAPKQESLSAATILKNLK